jgi:serine/threonine protein kinase
VIVGPLGSGGMGEVYRARDTRLGREVAIKLLPADVAVDEGRIARLEREARTVAALNHPGIVTLHSVEEARGMRFLTMELVEGQSLDNLVAPGGLPVARVLDLAIPLADALSAAHRKGVVHRGLKPGNLMLTPEGVLKVLDFGLAKVNPLDGPSLIMRRPSFSRGATPGPPLSSADAVLGTAPYMAPEQIRGEAVDGRTDLFALGIVLYELVSGRRPFVGQTFADVTSAILRDMPPPLSSVRADVPAGFERIVMRCLEKAPRGRYPAAADVLHDLRALSPSPEPGGAPAPGTPSASPVTTGPRPRRVAVIAIVALVLAALAAWFILRRGATP